MITQPQAPLPSWFLASRRDASVRKTVWTEPPMRLDYSHVGYELGRHTHEFVDESALNELEQALDRAELSERREVAWRWLSTNLAKFLSIVPARRRTNTFLDGFLEAIDDEVVFYY